MKRGIGPAHNMQWFNFGFQTEDSERARVNLIQRTLIPRRIPVKKTLTKKPLHQRTPRQINNTTEPVQPLPNPQGNL